MRLVRPQTHARVMRTCRQAHNIHDSHVGGGFAENRGSLLRVRGSTPGSFVASFPLSCTAVSICQSSFGTSHETPYITDCQWPEYTHHPPPHLFASRVSQLPILLHCSRDRPHECLWHIDSTRCVQQRAQRAVPPSSTVLARHQRNLPLQAVSACAVVGSEGMRVWASLVSTLQTLRPPFVITFTVTVTWFRIHLNSHVGASVALGVPG